MAGLAKRGFEVPPRSLRARTRFYVAAAFVVQIVALILIGFFLLRNTLLRYEASYIEERVASLREAIALDLSQLERTGRIFQSWDDTWYFLQGQHPDYPEENFTPAALVNMQVDLVTYFDLTGRVHYQAAVAKGSEHFVEVPASVVAAFSAGKAPQPGCDLMQLPEGILLYSWLPVVHTDGKGPIMGYGLFGRWLSDDQIAALARLSGLELTGVDLEASDLAEGQSHRLIRLSSHSAKVEVALRDRREHLVAILQADFVRTHLMNGVRNGRILVGTFLGFGILWAFLVVWLLDHVIVLRVEKLGQEMRSIASEGAFQRRVAPGRTDEIGRLGLDLNYLLERLEKSEADLRASLVKEKAASQAKSLFLANMSHEIRTPMNGIFGMVQILRDSPLTAEQASCVETIYGSCDVLLAVINDVLDFSKIESGALELAPETLRVEPLWREPMALVGPSIEARNVEFVCEVSPDMPAVVVVDGIRLKQVVLNLLTNAGKFTERGRVTLRVEADGREGEVGTLRFSVIDTGIGIAPEDAKRLFEPFRQVDPSMTRRAGGSGLGLAICMRLVRMMGGELTIESQLGHGSCFSFTVRAPFLPASAVTVAAPAPMDMIVDAVGSLRILAAEDNPVNRLVLQTMLRKLGYTCDLAQHGREAVKMALAQPYDLILMDIQMPELDGLAATEAIFAHLPPAQRPMIAALTAHAFDEDVARCQAAGMFCHLQKPLNLAKLRFALAETARLRRSEHREADPHAAI